VAATTGFTDLHILVLFIANDTDSSSTAKVYEPNLTTWKSDLAVLTFFSHELCTVAGATDHLGAFAGLEFNRVNGCADWNVADR
jgi:hypothetical protein